MGYYPSLRKWDKRFHKLRVTCKRKGVPIQAKTDYYAREESPVVRAQQAFDTGASAAFGAAEIGLRAEVSYDPKGGHTAHFDVRITQDVGGVPEGNVYVGQLQLAMIGYLTDGKAESACAVPLGLHYTAQEYDQAPSDGIVFSRNVMIERNEDKVRFIVFDSGSNAFGSVTIPSTLPPKASRTAARYGYRGENSLRIQFLVRFLHFPQDRLTCPMMPSFERRGTDTQSLGCFSSWNAVDVHEMNDHPGYGRQVSKQPCKNARPFFG